MLGCVALNSFTARAIPGTHAQKVRFVAPDLQAPVFSTTVVELDELALLLAVGLLDEDEVVDPHALTRRARPKDAAGAA
jgi:ATP:corrinoid adenosyltransferase